MAQHKSKVYLGYDEEYVNEKLSSLVDFTTNKIGGKPNWHNDQTKLESPQCRLCGLHQVLALQIYAPLDNSKYHRTLYIFACLNPNCWNHNESWTCLRVQSLEEATNTESLSSSCTKEKLNPTWWLSDADDWGDSVNDNESERNGNNVLANDPNKFSLSTQNINPEDKLEADFSELQVDDPNANSPTSVDSPVGVGAVGCLDSLKASAEIEAEESEVVCIDTPTQPRNDLLMLIQEVTPPPCPSLTDSKAVSHNAQFVEMFIVVVEEYDSSTSESSQHVRDLQVEYQRDDTKDEACKGYDTAAEKYEKDSPRHGDKMFHKFYTKMQENPGHILRYSRDNSVALLLYPMDGCIGRCRHCGEEMIFELQILPTLISKLELSGKSDRPFRLEFGTVLVFTCARSCWSNTDSYREEHMIVQAERM
ncbi:programmed cell death protein 2-like [Trichogramma pretiosum]|uniref:programmed cell death protein 2-like n=1 Tax=Trichogramma pretiosum TaxID=7493 RepID=UPI0006C940FF|nr:programmed cell death protein 2-like [Trichogramma pretiosum]